MFSWRPSHEENKIRDEENKILKSTLAFFENNKTSFWKIHFDFKSNFYFVSYSNKNLSVIYMPKI